MNLGGSSSARISERTKAVASPVASVICKPAVAAAWRSAQPSPKTANACARRSAAGSTRRTRAITRRPMPSSPPTSSSAGSISAACGSLRSGARRSSVTYNGLPPLAVHTALHNSSLDLLPNVARTSVPTAFSLNNAGRRAVGASARSANSVAFANAGSPGRSATSSTRFSPSSRRAR